MKSKLGIVRFIHRGSFRSVLSAAALLAAGLASRDAAAEFTLTNNDGWVLTIDGRLNGFINYGQGDRTPAGVAEWTAGIFENVDPNSGKISSICA